ncbi:MAG: PKD domain-containing protein [Bacteroidota bacterium]
MQTRYIFSVLLFITLQIQTQAQDQILSGQVNAYASVLDINACDNSILVSDPTFFPAGSSAILIQMKGATINETTDDENFGTITALNGAGFYEKVNIRSVSGDTIRLSNLLVNTYDPSAIVQLVSMPTYGNATVQDSVFAQPWDGQTGGVVAMRVEDALILNAPISADAAGFRGGVITDFGENDCTGGLNSAFLFAYPDGDWRGARKGEGVAQFIENKVSGRGAQANGGGGGNDHNSGGGGGANITSGGNGGNRVTPFVDLSLQCKGDNPGLSGSALDNTTERLFLGGGGGAGHTNNTPEGADVRGGHGGGIIIIEANMVTGNNQRISADGESAATIVGDGGSGGGAGGTIVLIVNSVTNNVILSAIGGDGADADNNNSDTCMGTGGGGSGGRIITNANNNAELQLAGGANGLSIGSTDGGCQSVSNNAESGENGVLDRLTALAMGAEMNSPLTIVQQPESIVACLGASGQFVVVAEGIDLSYQWQFDSGNGFTNLNNEGFPGVGTDSLTIPSISVDGSMNEYRVVVTSACGEEVISEAVSIEVSSEVAVPDFETELQPGGVVIFTSTSENAETYIYDFGDGVLSTNANTSFTFPEEGNYEVTLTVSNECGEQSITKTVTVVFEPTANFSFDSMASCAPVDIPFRNESTDNVSQYFWRFEGGMPETSTDENPTVSYTTFGTYSVTLVVSNEVGSDTLTLTDALQIQAAPSADFIEESLNDDLSIQLTNTTVGGESFSWDFGDGNGSTDINPTHTYDAPGTYTVTLTATNGCGDNSIEREVAVGSAPLAAFTSTATSGCFPVTIQFFDQSSGGVDERRWSFPGGQPNTSTEENPRITYDSVGLYMVSLRVRNELGGDEVVKDSLVLVLDAPRPQFTVEAMDGDVQFINTSENANRYIWSFGDGNTSTEESPMHTYDRSGLYFATLNAYNDACAATATVPVNILLSSTDRLGSEVEVKTFPNPVRTQLNIALAGLERERLEVRLLNLQGQVLMNRIVQGENNIQLDVAHLASGMYVLQVVGEDWQVSETLVKK